MIDMNEIIWLGVVEWIYDTDISRFVRAIFQGNITDIL